MYDHKGKGKGSCLESRLNDNACSTDFTFPLARWASMQPATIDPTLDLCTRYPLRLGGLRQCGIRSLPDTSAHGQYYFLCIANHLLTADGHLIFRGLCGYGLIHALYQP